MAPSSPRTSPCRTPLAYCVPVTLAFRSLPQRARVSPAQGLFTVRSFAQRPLPLDLRTARPPGPVNVPTSGLPCSALPARSSVTWSHLIVLYRFSLINQSPSPLPFSHVGVVSIGCSLSETRSANRKQWPECGEIKFAALQSLRANRCRPLTWQKVRSPALWHVC